MIIARKNYGAVNVVENKRWEYAVLNNADEIIVPYGKYAWIDGFDGGLARVKTADEKWGIIDESGVEVLPATYDSVWNFKKKNRINTTVELGSEKFSFDLTSHALRSYKSSIPIQSFLDCLREERVRHHYKEYAGTYAQDVMGYSDEDISDAFDGEPDAYWNID